MLSYNYANLVCNENIDNNNNNNNNISIVRVHALEAPLITNFVFVTKLHRHKLQNGLRSSNELLFA